METIKRKEYGVCAAYGARRLLGERWGGEIVSPDAEYFWDGEFYRVDELNYNAETNEVTMPDGVVLSGGNALHLYAPC